MRNGFLTTDNYFGTLDGGDGEAGGDDACLIADLVFFAERFASLGDAICDQLARHANGDLDETGEPDLPTAGALAIARDRLGGHSPAIDRWLAAMAKGDGIETLA